MKNGYIRILTENGWEYEHRVVWEQRNGPIPKGYVLHHINGDKTDNNIENLELISRKRHDSIESKARWERVERGELPAPAKINRKDFSEDLLRRLMREHKSLRQVAVILGVSKGVIIRNLQDMGIKYEFDRKTGDTTLIG